MSKLSKFVSERVQIGDTSYKEKHVDDLLSVWPDVERQCKQFIKELRKGKYTNLLYRGSNRSTHIGTKSVRQDRVPKDMPEDSHEAFDEAFDEVYGWKARSTGLFCTGNSNNAGSYGTVQIIFPIGKYEYLWSSNITDLYSDSGDGKDISETEPDSSLLREWEIEWDDQYGEGQDGEYLYQVSSGYYGREEEDAVDKIQNDEISNIEYEIGYEERKEEPDQDEIDDLNVKLNYANSDSFRNDVRDDLEWSPSMDLSDYIESQKEYWEGEPDVDAAMNFIRGEYSNRDLDKALNSGAEIMFKCKKYYFFNGVYIDLIKKLLQDDSYDPNQMDFDFGKK